MKQKTIDLIREDYRVFRKGHDYSLLECLYQPMFAAVVLIRISQWCYRIKLKPLAYLVTRLNDFLHGIWVGPRVEIGPGFFLGHARGLIINPNTKIGKNCVILQRVSIGGKNVVIGDNVFIGAGASIISSKEFGNPLRIGNNAKIGAAALIMSDVPDNAVMVAPLASPLQDVRSQKKFDS